MVTKRDALDNSVLASSLPPGGGRIQTISFEDEERQQVQTTSGGNGLPGDAISLDQFEQAAASHSVSIFKNYGGLQSTLMRYEDWIRKRWVKKTKAQRTKILVDAWHIELPKLHRPDLQRAIKFETEHLDEEDDTTGHDIYL